MITPTLHEAADALHISGYHAESRVVVGLIKERDALLASGISPALTPAAKELVALVFEYDQLHRSYVQDIAALRVLREERAEQMQIINNLAAALTARDEEIAVLMAERSFGKGEEHHAA